MWVVFSRCFDIPVVASWAMKYFVPCKIWFVFSIEILFVVDSLINTKWRQKLT